MPRDGLSQYSPPPGTQGIPNFTVESARYNAFVADITADQNNPRPIVAGGTGANSADGALDNLSAEKFKQVVTNWDSNPWRAGSFYAATTASGAAPVAGHAFAGIVYYANATDFVIEALDLTTGVKYVRYMTSGVWGTWGSEGYVQKAGDTMTGDLAFNRANPAATIRAKGQVAGLNRWTMDFGNSGTEPGGNVGSDFVISRYNDAGTVIFGDAVTIGRSDGLMRVTGDPTALLGVATKQYVDTGDANSVKVSVQALTAAQQAQARQNIYAAPFDALAFNGMQCNGSCEVNQQYGTGFSVGAWQNFTGWFTDGWYTYNQCTSAPIFTIDNPVPPGTPPFGNAFPRCYRIASNGAAGFSAATDKQVISHFIEGCRIARCSLGHATLGVPVSIGFWIYATISGTMCVVMGGHGTQARRYIQEVPVVGGAWTYVTKTFPPDTSGLANWPSGNSVGASISFCFGGGSTTKSGTANAWANWGSEWATANQSNFFSGANSVAITGLVILPGLELPNATQQPLIMRPYDQEATISERYYQLYNSTLVYSGWTAASGNATQDFFYTTQMRATPTVGFSSISYVNSSGLFVNAAYYNHVRMSIVFTAAAGGYASFDMSVSARMV